MNYAYSLSRGGDNAGAKREFNETGPLRSPLGLVLQQSRLAPFDADEDEIRDGKRAEEVIEQATELMPNQPALWDTRAAVCAELGRFDEAVKWQRRYLTSKELTEEQRKNGQHRLELYQQAKPYRQAPEG